MKTIQDLFDFILQQDRTIVFGNLGRYLKILLETLATIESLHVIILTNQCKVVSTINRIRIQSYKESIELCDLLIYIEPNSTQLVQKHPLANRVVVFTSHFTFQKPDNERWINVCYFHGMDVSGTQDLIARQDLPIHTQNVGLVGIDYIHTLTLSDRISAAPEFPNTYAIIDLTQFKIDSFSMYLAFWNAFDYLLEHKAHIHRWVTCYSDNGSQAFNRFTQRVLDALFCRNFEYGNITDHRDILSLLPFYKSAIVDKTFDLKPSSFGDIKFMAPKTLEDACKIASMYDVIPIVKNVLWLNH